MPNRPKFVRRAAAAGVVAASIGVGLAATNGSSGSAPTRQDVEPARVNVWAVGDAAASRCLSLPHSVIEPSPASSDGTLNVWAAGDLAVVRHFEQLAETCSEP